MDSKSKMVKAALSGLVLGSMCLSGCTTPAGGDAAASQAMGECHGVSSCKGAGECGGKGHSCGGTNECKGKSKEKMSQSDCEAKGGSFKKDM